MNPKIEKLTRDIEKARERISEQQARLRDMERQKTELENTEIVALFRSLDVAPGELPGFIARMQTSASLPETGGGRAAATPYTTTSSQTKEDIEDEE